MQESSINLKRKAQSKLHDTQPKHFFSFLCNWPNTIYMITINKCTEDTKHKISFT